MKNKKPKTPIIKSVVQRKSLPTPPIKTLTLRQRSLKFLKELKQKYPVIAQCHPLIVGINKELSTVHTEPQRIINSALHFHTHSKEYLLALSKGEPRHDLQNNVVETTDEFSRQRALGVYQTRYKATDYESNLKVRWKARLVRKVKTS
jgi:sRNA-binding protein